MAGEDRPRAAHNLILEDRKRLSVSGVEDVAVFDETAIRMKTSLGELTVQGEGLHVESLSVESGELLLTGRIGELIYSRQSERESLWTRLFG